MALNIKDADTEQLATEVAALASETKTRAINVALRERWVRLTAARASAGRSQRLRQFLGEEAWPQNPSRAPGCRVEHGRARGNPRVWPGGRVIVDGSAIVMIPLKESGWEPLLDHITADPAPGIGAPMLVETGIVLAARLGIPGKTLLARFVQGSDMRRIAFGADHWTVAVDAYLRYGKGRHPAALDFGDCLTYAVSRIADEPLLCIGDDFTKTDLALVRD